MVTEFVLVLFIVTCFAQTPIYEGIALVQSQEMSEVNGTVLFQQTGTSVNVTVMLSGLGSRTSVAIHVHDFGDLTSANGKMDGVSAGGHWVGAGSATHGCPPSATRHAGDMGSWTVVNGAISQSKTLDLLALYGTNSAIGRSVVVHDTLDSCAGTVGDAGKRIGFGVIGIHDSTNNVANTTVTGISSAVAIMTSTSNCPFVSGSGCSGIVWFTKTTKPSILITAHFPWINDGRAHGFHIHNFGNIVKPDGSGAGAHWKLPGPGKHGLPGAVDGHAGDLGNIQNYIDGGAWFQYESTAILSIESILGHAMILHLDKDHANGTTCDTSGSSGKRISMGVIGIQNTNAANTILSTIPNGAVFDNTIVPEDCSALVEMDAVAVIQGQSGTRVSGTVTFSQTSTTGWVLVSVNINGLGTRTEIGIHVHDFGDLTSTEGAKDGLSAGGHWIGGGSATHGCPGVNTTRHAGDMGIWKVRNGVVSQSKLLDLLSLDGSNSILGRAVVVHNLTDTCTGSVGNAGSRLGFGTIGSRFSTGTNVAKSTAANITRLVSVMGPTTGCTLPSCSGLVWFTQATAGGPITITARFLNMNDRKPRGIHIHTFGDLTAYNASNAGGHWNPSGASHNLPPSTQRHLGDLGNIQTFSGTEAWYQYTNPLLTNLHDLVGRAVVLHSLEDNGNGINCDAAGSSGARISMGVIGIQNNATVLPTVPTGLVFENNWTPKDCSTPPPPPTPGSIPKAIAVAKIIGQSGENPSGYVEFKEFDTSVEVSAYLFGLGTRSKVSIHVHEFGDLTSVGLEAKGLSTGGHYVGRGSAVHGCDNVAARHEGDMGSWNVVTGVVEQTKELDLLTLSGEFSILGRAIVVHDSAEVCDNGTIGNRIGFGVIGLSQDVDNLADFGMNIPTLHKYVAVMQSTESCSGDCSGFVWFERVDAGPSFIVTAYFPHIVDEGTGGSDSWHGLHIHTFGDLLPVNATGAGGHYNPDGRLHGLPPSTDRHQGDLGMVSGYLGQGGWYRYTIDNIPDLHSLVGRAVVLHSDRDHGNGEDCDQSGTSGYRVSAGIIGIQNNDQTMTMFPTVPDNLSFPDGWEPMSCNSSSIDGDEGSGAPWWAWLILTFGLIAIAVAVGLFFHAKMEKPSTEFV